MTEVLVREYERDAEFPRLVEDVRDVIREVPLALVNCEDDLGSVFRPAESRLTVANTGPKK